MRAKVSVFSDANGNKARCNQKIKSLTRSVLLRDAFP
jgi:hypothetical protein